MVFPEDLLRAFVISLGTFILGAITAVVWMGMRRGLVLREQDSPPTLRIGWPVAYLSMVAAIVSGRWERLGDPWSVQIWVSLVALVLNAIILGWTLVALRIKHKATKKPGEPTVDVETS